METSPELLIVGFVVLIVLLGVLVVFGMKPTDDRVGTPASAADEHPANASPPPTPAAGATEPAPLWQFALAMFAAAFLAVVIGRLVGPSPAVTYRIEAVEDGATIETLNRLGAEGWRVVAARRAIEDRRGLYEVILMKE